MLRFACADTLAALACDSTDVGLGIARAWLGDLLVHLTRNVKAHHSIRQVKHCYVKGAGLAVVEIVTIQYAMGMPASLLSHFLVSWPQTSFWAASAVTHSAPRVSEAAYAC